MRRIAAAVCLALALAACDEDQQVDPTPSPSATASHSASASVSSSPSASPTAPPSATPEPDLQLPADAPTELAEPLEPEDLAAADYAPLLPPGAIARAVEVSGEPVSQIAVGWFRGDDPFARETGLVVWQPFETETPWRAVYAFTDRPSKGVLGIALDAGDLTGDGLDDVLSREDLGGTGACAVWRVVAHGVGTAREVYRHDGCDTTVEIVDGNLAMREAVYEPDDPHCCPSAFRTTTLAWNGEAFVPTSKDVVENPS